MIDHAHQTEDLDCWCLARKPSINELNTSAVLPEDSMSGVGNDGEFTVGNGIGDDLSVFARFEDVFLADDDECGRVMPGRSEVRSRWEKQSSSSRKASKSRLS